MYILTDFCGFGLTYVALDDKISKTPIKILMLWCIEILTMQSQN